MQIRSRARDLDVKPKVEDVEDHRLREELRSCRHFFVDSDFERTRQKVFNYAIENLNAKVFDEKLDHFFNNLKCAAKWILAFGFILRNIEDGGFRYFFTHMKTIPCWIDTNLCAAGTIWQSQNVFSTKLTFLSLVAEKKRIQGGGFTSWRT